MRVTITDVTLRSRIVEIPHACACGADLCAPRSLTATRYRVLAFSGSLERGAGTKTLGPDVQLDLEDYDDAGDESGVLALMCQTCAREIVGGTFEETLP